MTEKRFTKYVPDSYNYTSIITIVDHETNKRREKQEIGIHSLRGGNKAGEHTVCFLGNDEEIIITHRAGSKRVFAEGALKAAAFLLEKDTGFYTMEDVIRV